MNTAVTTFATIPLQTVLVGRIEKLERLDDGRYVTRVLAKSSGEYGRTKEVKVYSDSAIGRKGDEISCLLEINSYYSTRRYTDKEGEIKVFQDANVSFIFSEMI